MTDKLTEQEFTKHVGTEFKIEGNGREVLLTLAEVKAYMPQENEQGGLERFSIIFEGPPDVFLPQQTYALRHDTMGELHVFLGAISGDEKGFRYEAVFNFYKR